MRDHLIDEERWARLTIVDQMGNIASEVGRTFSAIRRGDQDRARGACDRALDLLDLTARVWAGRHSPRTREILRARELFAESVMAGRDLHDLETYFMQFAIAARSYASAKLRESGFTEPSRE